MRFYPTRTSIAFLCFIVSSISLNLGCSKDSDLLIDSVLEDTSTAIEERTLDNLEAEASEELENVATVEENTTVSFETRTTSFSPSHDAHIQSGKGYNQRIIRLEEGQRPGFLMFDLSPIHAVNGAIAAAKLQFTINSDDGSGKVAVFKGSSNEWTENNLSESTAPETEVELGSIIKEYEIGATESIVLTPELILSDVYTLILNHSGGNDLAFASKEHASGIGPKLVITYEVPEGSNEIVIVDETNEQETTEEVTTAEETSEEVITEEETTPGETTPEETTPEEPSATNEEPMAVADATPSSGGVPLVVTFKGSNSSDDSGITSYRWDFKDGATDTSANPSHTYTKAGSYEATLTVSDAEGLSTTDTVTITVTEDQNEAPKALVSATPVSGEAPLEVSFKGSDSTDDHSIASYGWDFKDGSKTNVADFEYTYTTPGSYAAELTVTDENGLTNKKSITITVTAPQNKGPVAVVSANPTSGQAPLNVQFTGTNSTDDKAITSYFWDFKDGSTATSSNPSHSFAQAGSYSVDLTVKDAEGASSTEAITINVTAPITNNPPGYYVATNGNSSNNGSSPSSPWSLEHAINVAKAGDIIYVKAGNYGNKQLKQYNSGTSFQPIKFIGYTNTPGDLNSSNGSTFNYGSQLDQNKMPLLKGSFANNIGTGVALSIFGSNVELENFQITRYDTGLLVNSNYVKIKNIITTKMGDFNSSHSYPTGTSDGHLNYSGNGIVIEGNNMTVTNCFALNCGAEGITFRNTNNTKADLNKVYSDNNINPTDYYFLLSSGTTNSTFTNTTVFRVGSLTHFGHGLVAKGNNNVTGNTVNGFTITNTLLEVQFPKVSNNTFKNGTVSKQSHVNSSSDEVSGIILANGSHHNNFENINLSNCNIKFQDWNDGLSGDVNDSSDNNNFNNVNVSDTSTAIAFSYYNVANHSSSADNNTFQNCNFKNITNVFEVDRANSGTKLINCSINNANRLQFERIPGGPSYSLNVFYSNCSWNNVQFTPPN